MGFRRLGGRILGRVFRARRNISFYKPSITLAQAVTVFGSLTPIKATFNSKFRDFTKRLIKTNLFNLISLIAVELSKVYWEVLRALCYFICFFLCHSNLVKVAIKCFQYNNQFFYSMQLKWVYGFYSVSF